MLAGTFYILLYILWCSVAVSLAHGVCAASVQRQRERRKETRQSRFALSCRKGGKGELFFERTISREIAFLKITSNETSWFIYDNKNILNNRKSWVTYHTILAYVGPTGLLFKRQYHENVRPMEKLTRRIIDGKIILILVLIFLAREKFFTPLPGPIHRTPIENHVHYVTSIFEKMFWVSFSRFNNFASNFYVVIPWRTFLISLLNIFFLF